ncbi:hypothetical protein N7481_013434 [Penicillium waksmanii]|uniref:uncharacterized protein n=1 Tax=Penicillium waksmanii TaxID=69791 RepID=UPI002548D36C|nr:uncharacterized protein N7481_013434 [Penicillium waksmanii]KAJ5963129.1 hypothetical protein N7481_013434 [Penicillium waksmanii]
MTVTLGVINPDHAWEYTNTTSNCSKRTGISTVMIVVKYVARIIATVKVVIDIWKFLAGMIKLKSEADSCTLTNRTDISDDYFYGYAYKATTSGANYNTTAEHGAILSAVEICTATLHSKGTSVGCCTFHRGGTWHGHLQLSAEPVIYPVHKVTC